MLTRIRDRASGWIAWAIVILISVPFALWGVNSYFEGASKIVVATADGIEIEQEVYQQALSQQQRTLVQLSGRDFDPEFFSSEEFKKQVIDQLIDQTLQRSYVQSRGYHISDEELNLRIQAIPAFITEGLFDVQRYRELLSRAGLSISGFEQQQRIEAAFNQLESTIVTTAIVPKSRTDALIELLLEDREARYATFDLPIYLAETAVTDAEIQDAYQENRSSYFLPADVQVDYVMLSVDEIEEQVVLDERDARSTYEDNADRFMQSESRFVRHILVQIDADDDGGGVDVAQGRAKEIVSRIRNGDDFANIAEKVSDDPGSARRGGDLGIIQPGAMPAQFERAASVLSEGEISDPIRTEYGFHVIQVYKLIPAARKSYDEVHDQIVRELRRTEAEARFVEMSEDFRNISYEQADSLEPLAEMLDLDVRRSSWFSVDRGEDIFVNSDVRRAAFTDSVLVDELNSDVVEVDIDTLVVMRKLAYREKRPQTLSEVRPIIEEELRLNKAISDLETDGELIVEKLRLGDISWSELMVARSLEEKTYSSSALDQDQLLAPSIRLLIYSAPPPGKGEESYGSGWINNDMFLVYRLLAVTDGDTSIISDADREQMRSLVLRRDGLDMLLGVEQGLRAVADVEIFRSQM